MTEIADDPNAIASAIGPGLLKDATRLLGAALDLLPPQQRKGVANAVEHGARLAVEIEPLAKEPSILFVLVDSAEVRHVLGSFPVTRKSVRAH